MSTNKLSVAISAAVMVGSLAMTTSSFAAAPTDNTNVGDLALVPYYTANENFITGLHITNTSGNTQVVKVRLREGKDSNDAIDFIVVMSPYDVWTGSISDNNATGKVAVYTEDTSCTVPAADNNLIYPKKIDGTTAVLAGDTEGYIEVIAMGQTENEITLRNPLAYFAKHTAGVPNSCEKVRESFTAPRVDPSDPLIRTGVFSNAATFTSHTETLGGLPVGIGLATEYDDSDNVLRVSYFIRDASSGLEFGNTAVHVKDFADEPMMANQEFGLVDVASRPRLPTVWHQAGYDFPDLDGGAAANGGPTGYYNDLRAANVLGVDGISNDWSINSALGVSTDWTVTFAGQYLMNVDGDNDGILDKDIPVTAAYTVWDREEGMAPARGLVVSPSGTSNNEFPLDRESNVVEWFGGSVLKSNNPYGISDANPYDSFSPTYGWAKLDLTSNQPVAAGRAVSNLGSTVVGDVVTTNPTGPVADVDKTGTIVTIGYAAWKRKFAADLNRNYGRIAAHTTTTAN